MIADYKQIRHAVGKKKRKPLEVLREFAAGHGTKVREVGALLGVSESAASMILKANRALALGHVRNRAERFRGSTGLFVG